MTYTYDAAGELTDDGTHTYTWDAAHRLVSVTDTASGDVTSYTYDGLGRRVAIRTPAAGTASGSTTTYYLWCGTSPCQSRDSNNNVTDQYFVEGEVQGSENLLYARDRLGSVANLVDGPTGTVEATTTYDPWGNLGSSSGTYTSSFGYAGMFSDPSTGLDLTLYRAYNPAQYRWASRDPFGEATDFNLYRYVLDDPVNLVDLFGLCGQAHFYQITKATTCSPDNTFNMLELPGMSAPGAPEATAGVTPKITLWGNGGHNRIKQIVNPVTLTIVNITLPGHQFYPGQVTIQVNPGPSGHGSIIGITGTGTGPDPWLNDIIGKLFFGGVANIIALACAAAGGWGE